jgi:hypothetical protein
MRVKPKSKVKVELRPRISCRVHLTYFDTSGRYYASTVEERTVREDPRRPGLPYFNDVVAWIRGLHQGDGQGALPGLDPIEDVYWRGYVLIHLEDYPAEEPRLLILLGEA